MGENSVPVMAAAMILGEREGALA